MRRPGSRRRGAGFTLVEMLVAITVLAVLGLISWRGLDQLVTQRARLDDSTAGTEQVVRALSQLERDVAQRIPDALVAGRALPGSPLPAAVAVTIDANGQARIRILRTRAGAGTASVMWSVEAGNLVRTSTTSTTSATGTPADRIALLDGIDGVGVRVLLANGWVEARDLTRNAAIVAERGAAVEFSIDRGAAGRFTRVLAL